MRRQSVETSTLAVLLAEYAFGHSTLDLNLAKMSHLTVRTPMHSIAAREPLQVIAIVFSGPEPASSSIENVLVMTDVYSKFTIAVPTRNQTAQTVAKALVLEWFFRYGVPCRIHSDQGLRFDAKIITELYKTTPFRNPERPRTIRWETENDEI